jgi:predicted phosphoribosyltransferase
MLSARYENGNLGNDNSMLVLGIPKGGLVVANEIALELACKLDVICPVRIVDEDEETTIGSVLITNKIPEGLDILSQAQQENVSFYLNDNMKKDYLIKHQEKILKKILLIHAKFGSTSLNSITGKTVILADDGVYSGASAIVALKWIRTHQPKELIFATPIAPSEIVTKIKTDRKISVDHLEILKIPLSTDYKTVDFYYKNFEDVEDQWIDKIIKNFNIN